jgi:hypothetical protein
MSQRSDSERLTRMEDHQKDFASAIERIFKRLDNQDTKLDEITRKFDELQGAKKVLFGITALLATLITAAATYIGAHHK